MAPYTSSSTPQKPSTIGASQQSPALLRLSEQTQRFLNKSSSIAFSKKSSNLLSSADSVLDSEDSDSAPKANRFLKSSKAKLQPKPSTGKLYHSNKAPAVTGSSY